MTIDEAINILKCDNDYNKSIGCDTSYEEQLAEWLEELKIYQQHEIICNKGYNAGYNKAIDDFVKALQEKIEKDLANPDLALECKKCGIWKNYDIEKIAEQLKEREQNEQSI